MMCTKFFLECFFLNLSRTIATCFSGVIKLVRHKASYNFERIKPYIST